MVTVLLDIARHSVRVNFEGTDGRTLLGSSYDPFLTDHADALLFNLDVVDALPEYSDLEEVGQFDCGGAMNGVFRTSEGGYYYQIRNYDGAMAALVRTNADFSQVKATLQGDFSNKAYGLNNTLMIVYAFAAAFRQTLLIHASVTMKEGFGYLFLGKSGTGKSTHSRQWLENISATELLNDDNPVVRVEADGVYVYGTPWSGKTPCYKQKRVAVGAFVRIVQYPDNLITRNTPPQAFSSILSSCSSMIWDAPIYKSICGSVAALLQSVSAYTLQCRPEAEAAHLCYKTVGKS